MGNVILRRQRWIVPVQPVLDRIGGLSEAATFAALNHWRHDLGIPDRVFVVERVPHDYIQEFYKPQYVDFTSPLFLPVFRSVLASGLQQLCLDEMLPTPDAYPADAEGVHWGVEVQLDSLALQHSMRLVSRIALGGVHVTRNSLTEPSGLISEKEKSCRNRTRTS